MLRAFNLRFYRRFQRQLTLGALVAVATWLFPQLPVLAIAPSPLHEVVSESSMAVLEIAFDVTRHSPDSVLRFPEAQARTARYVVRAPVTAYSSTVDQTDSTPFITASGTTVRRGVVAANFLPIGTQVRLPDYYGEEVFVVEDRMNERYKVQLDIWMETREQAREWGIRHISIEVL